jgi:dihydroorotate dehydrogenase electron transfer subunit
VFLGARTKDLLILKDQFEELALKIYITTNDGSCGIQGFVTVPLEDSIRNLPDPQDACVYACGPKGMLIGIDALCEKYNIARQLSWEAIMRCGMGPAEIVNLKCPILDEPSDKPCRKKRGWDVRRTDQFTK